MKKRPSSFKAGYFEYEVDFDGKPTSSEHGETDTDTKIITVHSGYSESLNKETLFHEILHVALDDTFAFTGEHADELEERLIRIISPKLMQIFTDNEELSTYLFFDEEEEDYDE